MKRAITMMVLVMVILMTVAAPVEAKKVKPVKGKQVMCPYCIDGKHRDCPYWYTDTDGIGKHMTPVEIEEFCEMEKR